MLHLLFIERTSSLHEYDCRQLDNCQKMRLVLHILKLIQKLILYAMIFLRNNIIGKQISNVFPHF